MLHELFGENEQTLGCVQHSNHSTIDKTFKQERDWTCAIACLRTLLNGRKTEDEIIEYCEIVKGPKNSADVKRWVEAMQLDVSAKYGCDNLYINAKPAELLESLLRTSNVMLEIMLNYAHWVVVLDYVCKGDLKTDTIVIYDPYFDSVRLFPAEEIMSMWFGTGDNTRDRDFVAIDKEFIK